MFTLSSELKFHLYNQPTDMRKSFDSLSGIVRDILESNPCNGDVFIFINKTRNKVKLLHWQGSGFTLYYKRLEEGTFEIPRYGENVGSISLGYTQLAMIIDGLSIKNLPKRKRYATSVPSA
jgi:transposase